jgi:hypothetical protein
VRLRPYAPADQPLRRRQGVARRDLHIRLDPYAFPVRVRDRVDRACERDTDDEMFIDAVSRYGVRAAARRV